MLTAGMTLRLVGRGRRDGPRHRRRQRRRGGGRRLRVEIAAVVVRRRLSALEHGDAAGEVLEC